MATLSFEAETHPELVAKVRRWLASVDGGADHLSAAQAVQGAAELTKDALRIVAAAAPGPVADSDVVKGLTALGYQATDITSQRVVDALDALSVITGDGVLKRVREAQSAAAWQMSQTMARQLLKSLRR